jgi:hypothetical protein
MDADEASAILDDIELFTEKLSDWDLNFCDSLRQQLVRGRTELSEKQSERLEKIYHRLAK